jgi:hypothetical protein
VICTAWDLLKRIYRQFQLWEFRREMAYLRKLYPDVVDVDED